jgi:hypothetical protein
LSQRKGVLSLGAADAFEVASCDGMGNLILGGKMPSGSPRRCEAFPKAIGCRCRIFDESSQIGRVSAGIRDDKWTRKVLKRNVVLKRLDAMLNKNVICPDLECFQLTNRIR